MKKLKIALIYLASALLYGLIISILGMLKIKLGGIPILIIAILIFAFARKLSAKVNEKYILLENNKRLSKELNEIIDK